MLSAARVKQKAQSQSAPRREEARESCFSPRQMEQISGNVVFLSPPELAGAARSGERAQPVCLRTLSGKNLQSDVSEPGQSAV